MPSLCSALVIWPSLTQTAIVMCTQSPSVQLSKSCAPPRWPGCPPIAEYIPAILSSSHSCIHWIDSSSHSVCPSASALVTVLGFSRHVISAARSSSFSTLARRCCMPLRLHTSSTCWSSGGCVSSGHIAHAAVISSILSLAVVGDGSLARRVASWRALVAVASRCRSFACFSASRTARSDSSLAVFAARSPRSTSRASPSWRSALSLSSSAALRSAFAVACFSASVCPRLRSASSLSLRSLASSSSFFIRVPVCLVTNCACSSSSLALLRRCSSTSWFCSSRSSACWAVAISSLLAPPCAACAARSWNCIVRASSRSRRVLSSRSAAARLFASSYAHFRSSRCVSSCRASRRSRCPVSSSRRSSSFARLSSNRTRVSSSRCCSARRSARRVSAWRSCSSARLRACCIAAASVAACRACLCSVSVRSRSLRASSSALSCWRWLFRLLSSLSSLARWSRRSWSFPLCRSCRSSLSSCRLSSLALFSISLASASSRRSSSRCSRALLFRSFSSLSVLALVSSRFLSFSSSFRVSSLTVASLFAVAAAKAASVSAAVGVVVTAAVVVPPDSCAAMLACPICVIKYIAISLSCVPRPGFA